jgi:hypothetical protein
MKKTTVQDVGESGNEEAKEQVKHEKQPPHLHDKAMHKSFSSLPNAMHTTYCLPKQEDRTIVREGKAPCS